MTSAIWETVRSPQSPSMMDQMSEPRLYGFSGMATPPLPAFIHTLYRVALQPRRQFHQVSLRVFAVELLKAPAQSIRRGPVDDVQPDPLQPRRQFIDLIHVHHLRKSEIFLSIHFQILNCSLQLVELGLLVVNPDCAQADVTAVQQRV